MKNTKRLIFGMFVLVFVSLVFQANAEQAEQDQQKMMEAYKKMMALNENHAFLKNFVGEWDVKTTAWMQPGAEPIEAKNSAAAELIFGGRFLKLNFKGQMFGQPFEGLQIVGYDNLKKKFNTFWIDSSSTAFFLTEGIFDKDKKTITETGTWADPVTEGSIKVRAITTLVSQDEYVYQMFMAGPDGNEFKSMENISIRKK